MENNPEIMKIEIGQDSIRDLDQTRKWTMFISILSFIGIGLFVLLGMFAGVFLSVFNLGNAATGFPRWMMFVVILVLAGIYFVPVFFLFRFSKHTSNAVRTLDKLDLQKALKNLRRYYAYIGTLIIVMLTIYIFVFVVAGASVAFLKGL